MMTSKPDDNTGQSTEIVGLPFLSAEDMSALRPYFARKEFTSGETLWQEGALHHFLTLVLSGRIEETKTTEFGGKRFVVGVYGSGALLGEQALLDSQRSPFCATCLENAQLLSLSQDQFETLTKDNPRLAAHLLKSLNHSLADKLHKAFERMAAIF